MQIFPLRVRHRYLGFILNTLMMAMATAHAAAPSVILRAPEDVSWTVTTLRADVNPNGLETVVFFETGPAGGVFDAQSDIFTLPAVNGTGLVELNLNRSPGQAFIYRVTAINNDGNTVSTTVTHTPPAPEAPVLTLLPLELFSTAVILPYQIDPKGAETAVTMEWLGTDPASVDLTLEVPVALDAPPGSSGSFRVPNLLPSTTYFYRFRAESSAGIDAPNVLQITTPAQSAPFLSTLPDTAEGGSPVQRRLSAMVFPNGLATGVQLKYEAIGVTGFVQWENVGNQTPDNFTARQFLRVRSFPAATTVRYQFVAYNALGTTTGDWFEFTTGSTLPTIGTEFAGDVRITQAMLGTFGISNGEETTVYFEWGKTTSYGSETDPVVWDGDNQVRSHQFVLRNLEPSATYHYRTVAENVLGTSYGPDRTFVTLPETTPDVTDLDAELLDASSARLQGWVDAMGVPATVYFEWGQSPALGNTTDVQTVNVTEDSYHSQVINNLQPGIAYYHRMVVSNDWTTVFGETQILTIPVAAAPVATTQSADPILVSSAQLNGTVLPNIVATTAYFEWGTNTSYGIQTPVISVGQGAAVVPFTSVITNLQPETQYHYRLVAQNSFGTVPGADETFTTLPEQSRGQEAFGGDIDTQPPFTLGAGRFEFRGSNLNPDNFDAWNIHVPSGFAITGIEFYYSRTDPNGLQGQTIFEVQSGGTSVAQHTIPAGPSSQGIVNTGFSDTNPSFPLTDSVYRFSILTAFAFPESSWAVFVTVEALAPPPPDPVVDTGTAASIGTTNATLQGTVNPNNQNGYAFFEFGLTPQYGWDTPVIAVRIGTNDASFSIRVDLLPNTTYYYRAGFVVNGIRYVGPGRTLMTEKLDPVVDTFAATQVGTTNVTLSGSVMRNGHPGFGFFEYGPTDQYGWDSSVLVVSTSTVPATFEGVVSRFLEPGKTYFFRAAYVSDGVRTTGPGFEFTTMNPPPELDTFAAVDVGATNVTLRGSVTPNNLPGYGFFEYGPTEQYGWDTPVVSVPIGTNSAPFELTVSRFLAPNTLYHYRAGFVANGVRYTGPDQQFQTGFFPPVLEIYPATEVDHKRARLQGQVDGMGAGLHVWFQYGSSTNFGWDSLTQFLPASPGSTSFSESVSEFLQPNTVYHYRLCALDAGSNLWHSTSATFETLEIPVPPAITFISFTNAQTRIRGTGTEGHRVTLGFSENLSSLGAAGTSAVSIVEAGGVWEFLHETGTPQGVFKAVGPAP